MCNSRQIKDNSETTKQLKAASVNLSKVVLKITPSKLGRKGDPRMQKALEARLNNPSLSLLQALEIGGFVFRWEGETSYDLDNIQLSQRKNQLSRRLRLYKHGQHKGQASGAADTGNCQPNVPAKRNRINQPSLKKKGRHSKCPMRSNEKARTCGSTTPKEEIVKPQLSGVQVSDNESIPMPRLEGTNANINCGIQPMPAFSYANPTLTFPANAVAVNLPHTGSPMFNGGHGHFRPPSVSTISSSTSSLSSENDIKTSRQDRALSLYQSDSRILMKRCMISSGFSYQETEDASAAYLAFMERALEIEKMRIERIKSRLQHPNVEGTFEDAFPQITDNSLSTTIQEIWTPSPDTNTAAVAAPTEKTSHGVVLGGTTSSQKEGQVMMKEPVLSSHQASDPIADAIESDMMEGDCDENMVEEGSSEFAIEKYLEKIQEESAGSPLNVTGPKVLDLTEVNLDGDEWTAILQKSQSEKTLCA